MSAVKKYSPQPLEGITEVNMFKDDNTAIHFVKPTGSPSIKSSSSICCQGELCGYFWNT